jgi:tetratricopeptide (TPR) repeat protein
MSDKPEVASLQGNQYELMGKFEEARNVYRKASASNPQNEQLAREYYGAARQIKDYQGMGEALERLWLLSPANESTFYQLLEVAEGHNLEALLTRVIDRLEHINPINPRLYEARLNLAQRQGKTVQVLEAAQNYVRCGGQDPEIYQMGALSAQSLGRKDQVKEFYQLIQHVDKDAKTTYGLEARHRLAAFQASTATLAAQAPGATDRATSQSGSPSNKADARPPSSAAGSAPRSDPP